MLMYIVQRTEGSKSTKMERGTYLPLPVSVKKVSNEPPSLSSFASGSGRPSALRPCSRRYLEGHVSCCALRRRVHRRDVQLPGAVTELGTGLADVEVADLQSSLSACGRWSCLASVCEDHGAIGVQCDSLALG